MFIRDLSKDYLAINITKYRTARKMSRKEFAEHIEMDYQNYRKMENGNYSPGLDKLIHICNILDITPNELLLETRTFEDYTKDIRSTLEFKISDMLDTMKIIEGFRTDAKILQDNDNNDGAIVTLKEIMRLCAKNKERYIDAINYLYVKNQSFLKDESLKIKTSFEENRRITYPEIIENVLPLFAHSINDYWEISDYFYRLYITDYFNRYSREMFDELLSKKLKRK